MNEFNKTALVVRHNTFIAANHHLSLHENRLILWLISQIKKDDEKFTYYSVEIKQLANFIGIERNSIYEELRKATSKLMARVIEIETEDGHIQFAPISHAKFSLSSGTIEMGFSESMRPYLLKLQENFTTIELQEAMRFKSTYPFRIFDIIKMNSFKGNKFSIKIAKLRKMLGIQDTQYKRFYDFKKRVLLPSQSEINKRTEIQVEYEFIKKGKFIDEIIFKITKNGADISYLADSTDDKLLHQLEKIGFNAKDGAQLIEQHKDDPERIIFALDYVKHEVRQGKDIENPAGLLVHMIKQDRRPQTSFRDELLKDDKTKKERQKQVQAEIAKFEQEINVLSRMIESQSKLYQDYRTEEIVKAVEKIETEVQEHHEAEFIKTLDSGIVKNLFAKKGWTHRLITRDAIEYLQGNGFLGQVLKQEDWEREQGFKTHDQIEQDQNQLKKSIKSIHQKALKTG